MIPVVKPAIIVQGMQPTPPATPIMFTNVPTSEPKKFFIQPNHPPYLPETAILIS